VKLQSLLPLLSVTSLLCAEATAEPTASETYALDPLPFGREIYDYTPDFDGDAKTVLFSSNRTDGDEQLFTVDVETGKIAQLTSGPERNHYGSYSPDGSKIAFVSARTGTEALWVMNRDGSDPRRLTEDGHSFSERPDWSPDGRFLAFDREENGRRKIWTLEIETGVLHRVTDGPGEDTYTSWSADGQQLVFMSRGRRPSIDLWIVGLDGSDLRRLTDLPNMVWAPHWSDDGSRITFWSGEGWDYQVYTIAPDGTDLEQLTDAWEYNWSPRWSRDGEWIAFRSSRSGQGGAIWIMRADGSGARPLTELGASDFARSVRGEGVDSALSRLAYSRQRDPQSVFTSNTECRVLIRELVERGELEQARRLADWNLLERPGSSDAGDIWIDVRRALGEPSPPTARELVAHFRRGAYGEARALYAEGRRAFPEWRPFSASWFRWLLQELGWLAAHEETAWLAEEALVFFPEQAGFHAAQAVALDGLGKKERAVAAARRALELDPDDRTALQLLAEKR